MSLSVRRQNSSALQGRWLEEPEGFPAHVSFRKGDKTAIMAAARRTEGGYAPVGVRPPPPLRGSSPCEAGQFCHPHGEKRVVTSRAEFVKSPLKFNCLT